MTFWKWSRTAASNSTADSTINWQEGQAPSTVNDAGRGMMAAASKFRDDISGATVTGGTSGAYTLSTYQGFDTLAHLNGNMVAFTPNVTNAAGVTLNVDGLGARPLRSSPGVDLIAGVLVAGTPYMATYYNASSEFILAGFFNSPYAVPISTPLPYFGHTAPNSCFALPYGQAISRTQYATLFNLIGTEHGAGDGSTTFNLPDIRGRLMAFWDSMGGTPAGRLAYASAGIDGTTIGGTGGAQTRTLSIANLPVITPSGTVSVSTPAGTIGAITPSGSVSTPSGTISTITPSGTISTFTPAGTISAVTGTISQITPAGSVSVTAAGTISAVSPSGWSVSVTSTISNILRSSTHDNYTSTAGDAGFIQNVTNGAVTSTGGAGSITGTAVTPTFTNSGSTGSFSGTPVTPTFSGNAPTFSGNSVTPTFSGNSVTPTFTGAAATFTGNSVTPTFTGSPSSASFTGDSFGSGAAFSTAQPTIVVNCILRII